MRETGEKPVIGRVVVRQWYSADRRRGGLESASEVAAGVPVLDELLGETPDSPAPAHVPLTPQRARRIESVQMVRHDREEGRPELAFNSRPFVLCGLPIRRLPAGQLRHVRWNGRYKLEVVGDPEYGVPFGQDRLIPI